MALKNIFKLAKRRQGELVGQVFKFISCYNDFFPLRARTYLKELATHTDTIYWLENSKTNEVTTLSVVDPKYTLEVDGITLISLGHTISKIQNQIHNILDHILGDYKNSSIVSFVRPTFGLAMGLKARYGFTSFTPLEVSQFWPSVANKITDYFNLASGETIISGCSRKGCDLYIKLTQADLDILTATLPDFAALYKIRLEVQSQLLSE
jgi:hypothetical protein